MFSVIYPGFLKPKKESLYHASWHQIAGHFVKECGALGSALHQTETGEWIAYSRWPDQKTRDKAWIDQEKKAIQVLKECLDQDRPSEEIPMTLIGDLLK